MKALIIVDVQNDFCEGGSLQVKNSNEIFPFINNLLKREEFSAIFVSKDWHSLNHISFAVNHGRNPFETIADKDGNKLTLWPVHCIQGTYGSQLHKELEVKDIQFTQILKGYIETEECYSAFGTEKNPTELETLLKLRQIKDVVVVGLALDFCVGSTALDAKRAGFNVSVIEEATRPVNLETGNIMIKQLEKNGVSYKSFKNYTQLSSITNDSGDESSSQQN